ncbi:response regulator [Malaciobacter canalis]|uniref:response regulator n=1 Tax=Malaciobacter canalis TaxID=1912871 RepID=UPI00384F7AD8
MQEKIDKLKNYKILFVDDEEDIQIALANILENLKVEYYIANNGKEALEILKENDNINFVVTDINMPSMNGLELIEQIKKESKNIEFIILTAHSESPYIKKADSLNIKGYLVKPMDIIELINKIVE